MKDVRQTIYAAITALLEPMAIPSYSFVPSNEGTPFVFFELSALEQIENKSNFYQQGVLDVELFSGTNQSTASIQTYIDYMNEIKVRLQPYIAFKPVNEMTYWRVLNDAGLQQISETERVYVGSIQYEFQMLQSLTYYDRVVNDGGVVEALDCVLDKIL